jgi:hypothetical protein
MLKTTKDFLQNPSYQEANAIQNKPVYIGKQEWKNEETGKVIRSPGLKRDLGPDDVLDDYKKDIDINLTNSQYYGCAFYPEKTLDKKGATREQIYEMNKAFIAGAIDANREFILVTDINHYRGVGGTTVDELLWLSDNGYIFEPVPDNIKQTKAIRTNPAPECIIKDYKSGRGLGIDKNQMNQRLKEIKGQILDSRAALHATVEASTTTSTSTEISENINSTSSSSAEKYVPPHLKKKQADNSSTSTSSSPPSYSQMQSQSSSSSSSSRADSASSWRSKPAQESSSLSNTTINTTSSSSTRGRSDFDERNRYGSSSLSATSTSGSWRKPPATTSGQPYIPGTAASPQSKQQSTPPKASPAKK